MQRKIHDRNITIEELKSLITDENVNDRSYNGLANTVLLNSAIEPFDREERFEICMQHHADVNLQNQHPEDPYWNTALHLVIANEAYADAVAYVRLAKKYQLKIDFNIPDREGKTTLILACKMRFSRMAIALLREKKSGTDMDVNVADHAGNTALHYACALGMTDVVHQLVELGADIHKENNKRRTPIDMTRLTADEIKEIFSSVSINPERDENAVYNEFVDQYYQAFIDINKREIIRIATNKENMGKLKEALDKKLIDTVIAHRKKEPRPMSKEEKRKILQYAESFTGRNIVDSCVAQQREMLEVMLGLKANVGFVFRSLASANQPKEMELILKFQPEVLNACGKPSGRSALHYAADKNSTDVCALLIAHHADAKLLDEAGNTALHLACAKGHIAIVKLLLELDCNLDQKNKEGQTPWQLLQVVFSKSSLNAETKIEMEKLFAAKRTRATIAKASEVLIGLMY